MRALGWLAVLGALATCDGASSELGYEADLQIPGAQYRPGAFPAPTGGPETLAITTLHSEFVIGRIHERLHGVIGPTAHGAIVGIAGDTGAWILPAGPPAFDTPDDGTIDGEFGLSDVAPDGPFEIQMAAVDADGKIGEPLAVSLVADDVAPPSGSLVVGLAWTGAADLDLHVIDPSGSEVYFGNPNSIPLPDVMTCGCNPTDQSRFYDGGVLDHDSNKQCELDGRPNEHVVWKAMPEAGTYTVRVDARAMCGDASAHWFVEVLDGNAAVITSARGISTPDDVTYQQHGAGAGQTALTFQR